MALECRSTQRRFSRAAGHGFSLIELLIVTALIVFMFTLYFGGGSRGFQKQQMARCDGNLQKLQVTLKTYALDNQDKFPALSDVATSEPVLSLLVPRSTSTTDFFICPGSKDKPIEDGQPFARGRISYAYYMGCNGQDGADTPLASDRQVNTNSKRRGQPLFSQDGKAPGNNHSKYGGNVLFCDGSVKNSAPFAAFDLTNGSNVVLLNPKP